MSEASFAPRNETLELRATIPNAETSGVTASTRVHRPSGRELPQLAGSATTEEPFALVMQLREKTTLEVVLRLAADHSPRVRAAAQRWQAATHKRAQAVTLPDPKVEASYFIRQVDDRWMLSLSQEIPYPGKLLLGGRIADADAQTAHIRYQAAIRDALAEAKEMYFELYYIDRAQHITAAIKSLYERYAALAAGGKEVGKTKLPETFRAESQRAQLGYDLLLLQEMRATEAQRLRAIMGMQGENDLGPTEDVAMPLPLGTSLQTLAAVAEQHNQELLAAGVEIERAGYQTRLARQAPIPDLMVGVSYTDMLEVPSSKNPLSVNIGVSIPLWFGKYRAMEKEARAMAEAMQSEQVATQLQVRSDLGRAYFRLKNAGRLVQLYNDTLVPQARQALQSVEELYRKGDATLAAILELTATVHNFELARLRATADYYQNVARIERVLGMALTLTPAAPRPTAAEDTP
ncbi:MAG: TolC family protein [Candidatus Tectimicrobiota bacterium]